MKLEDELRKAISVIPVPSDFTVLDVGCGDGFFSGLWAERLSETGALTGVDVSEDYLLFARKRLKNERRATFVQGRIERLPFDAGSFDVAGLRDRVRPHLAPDDLLTCEQLLDPGSAAYVLKKGVCNATIIDHLIWGSPKKMGR